MKSVRNTGKGSSKPAGSVPQGSQPKAGWDECPEADDCELIRSFLELVDAMVEVL